MESNNLTTKQISNKNLIMNVLSKMKLRGFEGYYCDSANDAVATIKKLLPQNATVAFGGSETLKETGIADLLKNGDYVFLDRTTSKTPEEAREMYAKFTLSDYFFMSSNAITYDGQLVNIDGTGNRTTCLIHGPKNVIVIAGINKLVNTLDMAIDRAKNTAAPPNAVRLNRNTPCSELGRCADCLVNDCMCCNTVITRKSYIDGRIKVILINDDFGY